MWTPRTAHVRNVSWVLAVLGLAFAWGCGGDDSPTSPEPVENPQQTLEDGLTDLDAFTSSTNDDPTSVLMEETRFTQILEQFGVSIFKTMETVREGFSVMPRDWSELRVGKQSLLRPKLSMLEGAGTYDWDGTHENPPFPGWTLTIPNVPSDGFIFRFGLDDGFFYFDETTMQEVPVRGELRVLGVEINDAGTPMDLSDDYLEHVVIEMAASTEPEPELAPTLARLEFTLTLTATSFRFTVGRASASDPGDAGASFIGPVLFHTELVATQTSIAAVEQLYHSVERFGARAESDLEFDPQTEQPTSATFVVAVGETSNPAAPPLRIALNLSNFRMEGFVEIADVNGSITYNGGAIATLVGDTSEVPVDLNGDGEMDGTCVNVQITFWDSGESDNICEAVESFDPSLFPTLAPVSGRPD